MPKVFRQATETKDDQLLKKYEGKSIETIKAQGNVAAQLQAIFAQRNSKQQ